MLLFACDQFKKLGQKGLSKTLLIMNLTTVFLFSVCMVANAETFSQKVSLSEKDIRLEKVFKEIKKQTGYTFIYTQSLLKKSKNISMSVKDMPMEDFLEICLKEQPLAYTLLNKMVIIREKQVAPEKELSANLTLLPAVDIRGKVTGENGEPLSGATINEKGTNNTTTSDASGNYVLKVTDKKAVLIISYVGYKNMELKLDGRSDVTVALTLLVSPMNDIVVVGYGTQKKVNLIGSVATITSKDISAAPVGSLSNALAGRLPGAIVQQASGEPGKDGATILIRGANTLGNNAPLVVIDGIPGRDLNALNAEDVESISILKDASAAIYGARAANGVILVTTKAGKVNAAPVITYSFYEGRLSPVSLPQMADAATYATMMRETQGYRGVDPSNMLFSLTDIEKYKSGSSPWTHPSTNWFNSVFNKSSVTKNHDISIAGGGKSVSYYVGFGSQFDDGIYKNSATSFKRYNFKANINAEIGEYLKVGFNSDGIQADANYSAFNSYEVFRGAMRSRPTVSAIFPNGLPGPDIENGWQPVVLPTSSTGFNNGTNFTSYNTLTANLKIPWVSGLSLSSFYSYDLNFSNNKSFSKSYTLYSLDESAYTSAGNTGKEDGSAFLIGTSKGPQDPRLSNSYSNSKSHTVNFKINYEKTINNVHNISAFAAYENSEYLGQGISAYRRYFITDRLPYLFAGGNLEKDNSEFISLDSRINYFGRLSYNYKEKYLFQFSFRRDGSLRFSKESGRWGNFPSVLAGWKISNEEFWKKNVKFIEYFKLRGSWGMMGNDLVDPFQYLTTFGFSGNGVVLNNSKDFIAALSQVGNPNPLITWEVANVYNLGFEASALDRKLTLNADFFYQKRSKILVKRNASVPSYTGIGLPDDNYGIVESKGFEIELGYNERKSKVTYGINANISFAKNTVVEFDEPKSNFDYQRLTGHPQGSTLLYTSLGVFKDQAQIDAYPHVNNARPGDLILEDYNQDGKITTADRVLYDKTAVPQITYGISFNVGYKNFVLSGLIQGVSETMKKVYFDLQGNSGNYFNYDAEGRWTPTNTNASKPRAFEREQEYWRSGFMSNYWFHSAAFARLKNLQLAYTLPAKALQTIKLKGLQLYISGQNLFLIRSSMPIMDPELNAPTAYPLMKVYAIGARVNL